MGPSLRNFWLAIVAAATAATDVATTAAFMVRAYEDEDEDLRGPEERCESHRRLLFSAVFAFLLSIVSRGQTRNDCGRGPIENIIKQVLRLASPR
jgi:hypothetical protein